MKYELDFISILQFLYGLRLIKFFRYIPTWGPMILAIIDTIRDIDVMLYLFAFFFITLMTSISYAVSYSAEVEQFSNLLYVFFQLFSSSFNNNYDITYNLDRRFVYTIYFIVYVFLSIALVSLFVGIVAELYPKVREQSVINWEILMAEYMVDDILSMQTDSKDNFDIKRRSVVLELLDEDYWGTKMEGRDGVIYWTTNGLFKKEKKKKMKKQFDIKSEDKENNSLEIGKSLVKEVKRIKSTLTGHGEGISKLAGYVKELNDAIQVIQEKAKVTDIFESKHTVLLRRVKDKVRTIPTAPQDK